MHNNILPILIAIWIRGLTHPNVWVCKKQRKPKSLIVLDNLFRQLLADEAIPYNSQTIIKIWPLYWPNYGPALNQAFWLGGSLRYAFFTLADNTSKLFKAAMTKAIFVLFRDTTDAYVIASGVSIVCLSATKRTLWVSVVALISKIRWHLISWYHIGATSSSSFTSKATWIFFISFSQAILRRLVPFCFSNYMACL